MKDAAVVGLPSAQGPQVHAVLLRDLEAPAPDAIIRQANERLAPHQRIRGVTVWPDPDFPRTHTLKVKSTKSWRLPEKDGRGARGGPTGRTVMETISHPVSL